MNTIPRDISNIIVTGNWGVGKTQLIIRLHNYLTREKGINAVHLMSDRIRFEEAVRLDTLNGARQPDGSIIGPHSILVKDGFPGYMDFRVLGGAPFNQVHRDMLKELRGTTPGEVRLMEYAIGKTTSINKGEVLDQSGHFIVESLIDSGAVDKTLIVQLDAPFNVRRKYQEKRDDPTDMQAFDTYGQPGGLISVRDGRRIGNHLVRVKNKGIDLDTLTERIFFDHIRSRLLRDETHLSIEGGSSFMPKGSRR